MTTTREYWRTWKRRKLGIPESIWLGLDAELARRNPIFKLSTEELRRRATEGMRRRRSKLKQGEPRLQERVT